VELKTLIGDLGRRVNELRFLEGIEKAEHVPYSTGDEFWVRFSRPIDMTRLLEAVAKNKLQLVRFGAMPSKLPRKLGEILWNGVSHVIVKRIGFMGLLTSFLGFEPDGVAKIAKDLHSSNPIFMAKDEEGMKVLYDYLGIKYVPPAPPPPKPVAPAKPTAPPPAAKPPPAAAQKPTTPGITPTPAAKPAQTPLPTQAPSSTPARATPPQGATAKPTAQSGATTVTAKPPSPPTPAPQQSTQKTATAGASDKKEENEQTSQAQS
jgi:hypothetical protein